MRGSGCAVRRSVRPAAGPGAGAGSPSVCRGRGLAWRVPSGVRGRHRGPVCGLGPRAAGGRARRGRWGAARRPVSGAVRPASGSRRWGRAAARSGSLRRGQGGPGRRVAGAGPVGGRAVPRWCDGRAGAGRGLRAVSAGVRGVGVLGGVPGFRGRGRAGAGRGGVGVVPLGVCRGAGRGRTPACGAGGGPAPAGRWQGLRWWVRREGRCARRYGPGARVDAPAGTRVRGRSASASASASASVGVGAVPEPGFPRAGGRSRCAGPGRGAPAARPGHGLAGHVTGR